MTSLTHRDMVEDDMPKETTLDDVLEAVRDGFEANDEQHKRTEEKLDHVDRRFDRLEGKVHVLVDVLKQKDAISEDDKRQIHA